MLLLCIPTAFGSVPCNIATEWYYDFIILFYDFGPPMQERDPLPEILLQTGMEKQRKTQIQTKGNGISDDQKSFIMIMASILLHLQLETFPLQIVWHGNILMLLEGGGKEGKLKKNWSLKRQKLQKGIQTMDSRERQEAVQIKRIRKFSRQRGFIIVHALPTTMFAQIYQGYQECYNDTSSPMVLVLTTVISKTYRAHRWLETL